MKQESIPVQLIDQLVINWHITEVCNYHCEYCYAKWHQKDDLRELIHNPEKSSLLLKKLYEYFQPNNPLNPLSKHLSWNSVRLNIAGGEPTLYKEKLLYILKEAKDAGFETSIISNGSQFSDLDFVSSLSNTVSLLGVSIDSIHPEVNRIIGREDRKTKQLDMSTLTKALLLAREVNPDITIKLNSVINHSNYLSDMNTMIEGLQPDKWKVLRMLPVISDALMVSDEEFDVFIKRHASVSKFMVVEDNKDMTESYIMLDPLGRFFQNSPENKDNTYSYSSSILSATVDDAFQAINFSAEKFLGRYSKGSA